MECFWPNDFPLLLLFNIYSTLDIHDLSKSDRVLDQIEYKYLN